MIRKTRVLVISVVLIAMLGFLISCGGEKPSRDATEAEVEAAITPVMLLLMHTMFTLPFEDFSELPVVYGTEEFSAEIGSKGSGLTYKASGDLEGMQNIEADLRIDGISADYIATQINPFGGGTPEELSTLDISGVITWSLDGNGAKLDIKEITISDDETSGEVWYTLPETKEVVRIPLDGSMLW